MTQYEIALAYIHLHFPMFKIRVIRGTTIVVEYGRKVLGAGLSAEAAIIDAYIKQTAPKPMPTPPTPTTPAKPAIDYASKPHRRLSREVRNMRVNIGSPGNEGGYRADLYISRNEAYTYDTMLYRCWFRDLGLDISRNIRRFDRYILVGIDWSRGDYMTPTEYVVRRTSSIVVRVKPRVKGWAYSLLVCDKGNSIAPGADDGHLSRRDIVGLAEQYPQLFRRIEYGGRDSHRDANPLYAPSCVFEYPMLRPTVEEFRRVGSLFVMDIKRRINDHRENLEKMGYQHMGAMPRLPVMPREPISYEGETDGTF